MCSRIGDTSEGIAFIIRERCKICNMNNVFNTDRIIDSLCEQTRLSKYSCRIGEKECGIAIIDMDDSSSVDWLKEILGRSELAKRIKYLFIEDNGMGQIPDLTQQFKVVVLDKEVDLLPAFIRQEELSRAIQVKLERIKKREVTRYLRKRISEESRVDINKPCKPLTAVRKVILRKKLEKYGKLQDVLRVLGEENDTN